MKKHNKFIVLALFLASMTFLFSCRIGLGALKYVEADDKQSTVFSNARVINLPGTRQGEAVGGLIELKDTTSGNPTHYVYSLDKGNYVYQYQNLNYDTQVSIDLFTIPNTSTTYFTVTKTNLEGDIIDKELYDGNGNFIDRCQTNAMVTVIKEELIVFNEVAYSLTNSKDSGSSLFEEAFEVDEFANLDGISYVSKDYFYYEVSSPIDGILVTDRQGAPVSTYTFKTWFSQHAHYYLQDGRIAIQYYEVLPEDENRYDFTISYSYSSLMKIKLHTEIFNPKNGNVSKKHVKFVISSVDPLEGEKAKYNTAVINRIEDKKINENSEYVILKNNLGIKASFNDVVENCSSVEKISDDFYLVSDDFGQTHVIDGKGKTVRTIKNNTLNHNGAYIWTDSAIYNYDFDKVLDLKAKEYVIEHTLGNTFILSKTTLLGTEYYSYHNGIERSLNSSVTGENYYSCDEILGIYWSKFEANTPSYSYYNGEGKLLFSSIDASYEVIAKTDKCVLIALNDIDGDKYYLLSA